jgi:hypothetical protein
MKIGFSALGNTRSAVAKRLGPPGTAAAVPGAHYDMEAGAFRDPRIQLGAKHGCARWVASRVLVRPGVSIVRVTLILRSTPVIFARADARMTAI